MRAGVPRFSARCTAGAYPPTLILPPRAGRMMSERRDAEPPFSTRPASGADHHRILETVGKISVGWDDGP